MKNYQEALDTINNLRLGEGNWKTYLRIQSSFIGYSNNNKMIILAQRPDATMVSRFGYWKKIGRFVKKGESALRIFAPIFKKDEDGKDELKGFVMVPVFDVSQTEGKPLPEIDINLDKTSAQIITGIENLTSTPIVFESESSLKKAVLDESGLIVIPDRGSDIENVQNVIKGYTRYISEKEDICSIYPAMPKDDFLEMLSESVNYVVSATFKFTATEYDLSPGLLKDDTFLKTVSPYISKIAATIVDMVYTGLGDTPSEDDAITAVDVYTA